MKGSLPAVDGLVIVGGCVAAGTLPAGNAKGTGVPTACGTCVAPPGAPLWASPAACPLLIGCMGMGRGKVKGIWAMGRRGEGWSVTGRASSGRRVLIRDATSNSSVSTPSTAWGGWEGWGGWGMEGIRGGGGAEALGSRRSPKPWAPTPPPPMRPCKGGNCNLSAGLVEVAGGGVSLSWPPSPTPLAPAGGAE